MNSGQQGGNASYQSTVSAYWENFLGQAPEWYKATILFFLLANPILLAVAGPFVTGWCVVIEFIFTLAMALRCYPLQPGGLIALEAIIIGLSSTGTVEHEVFDKFSVILLNLAGCALQSRHLVLVLFCVGGAFRVS